MESQLEAELQGGGPAQGRITVNITKGDRAQTAKLADRE